MKFGIVTFPGSNCDYDAYHAVTEILGEEATYLWHKDHDLQGSDVIILPGGFSYGDYLRAGAIARSGLPAWYSLRRCVEETAIGRLRRSHGGVYSGA